MAPGTRRANRSGYVEHDDFEGLPVRQWRHDWVSVMPPAPQEQQQRNDIWDIELLHGMPKDAGLLPLHTQELLRAARSGRLYKRPAPAEDEEGDGDAGAPEKGEKKDEDANEQGYQLKVWKQIPRNNEGSSVSHLAKRRKNIITISSRTVEEKVQGPTVTRATVRRIDAAGNPYTEEITLADGQQPDGEVISTRVEALPASKVEAAPAATPAQRRRPPPPKRKSKAGPGRGKKKNKHLQSGAAQLVAPVAPGAVAAPTAVVKVEEAGINTPQTEIQTPGHDNEMADGDDDDDNDDGDDGDESDDGDEGEGDETTLDPDQSVLLPPAENTNTLSVDHKEQDHEMVDASYIEDISILEKPDTDMKDEPASKLEVPHNPLTLATHPLSVAVTMLEGSPLKNVVLPSPTDPVAPASEVQPPEPTTTIKEASVVAASTVAEPPSTVVGDAPQDAIERDIPHSNVDTEVELLAQHETIKEEEALLPPPPDQVGNISSPKEADVSFKMADHEPKDKEEAPQPEEDAPLEKPPLNHTFSTLTNATEDSIKPEDSVSVTAPMVDSAAPSEAGLSMEEAKDDPDTAAITEQLTEPLNIELEKEPTPPVVDDEPDLLGGLMGELDRHVEATREEPAAETALVEPTAEPVVTGEVPDSAAETPVPDETQFAELETEALVESEPAAPPSVEEKEVEPPVEAEPETDAMVIDEPEPEPQPDEQLVAESSAKSVDEPMTEPPAEPAPEPTSESIPAPEPETVTEAVAEETPEKAAEAATEIPPVAAPEAELEVESEPVVDKEPEPSTEAANEAPAEAPITEPEPAATAEETAPVEEKKEDTAES